MKSGLLCVIVSLPLIVGREVVRKVNLNVSVKEVVTVTTYHAVPGQTDSTPFVTASGYKINQLNPEEDKIIAISRDLKEKFKFGDSVLITNIGKYDGVYYVQDVMNKRFRKKIDILINRKDKGNKFLNVLITKL